MFNLLPSRRSTAATSSKACCRPAGACSFRRLGRYSLLVLMILLLVLPAISRSADIVGRLVSPIVDCDRAHACSGLFGFAHADDAPRLDHPRQAASASARPRRSARSSALLREAGEPKTKVGHGGTLDPLASGVLPIALGEATKLAGRMLDATKAYDFTIRFGEETDTLDLEGAGRRDQRRPADAEPRSRRSCRASPARSSRSRRPIRR